MRLDSKELGRVFLAPLSGIADSPFRRICKRFGADTVYSEMVSSEGLIRGNAKTRQVVRFTAEERPIGIQIFGSHPERMAEAARVVEALAPDFIDINLACPARRIVSKGAGCALMRDPNRARQLVSSVVRATRLAVTAKIRIGWDDKTINAVEFARLLEDAGVAAVTVHGRTWKQGFKDRSSWDEVTKVKQTIGIPVVLSGDVTTAAEAQRAFEETGCDALMVGRGVYGQPWIFQAIGHRLAGRTCQEPSPHRKVKVVLEHLDLGIAQYGERMAVVRFRKHLIWYTKGIRGVASSRRSMSGMSTRQEVACLLRQLFDGEGP